MLILVGVTVTTAINGGLITATHEAKFKTEVRQIEESLQIKKAIMKVEGKESNITIADLDIDEILKTKFKDKLSVQEDSGDYILCYKAENVTTQEKEWLEELGIYGEWTFKDYITISANKSRNSEGYIGLDTLATNIESKYPNACIAYGIMNQLTAPKDVGEIFGIDSDYKDLIKLYASFDGFDLEIDAKGHVSDVNNVDNVGIILMSEEKASLMFRFSETDPTGTNDLTGEELPTYAIVAYIGEETEKVRVPNVIYNSETGEKTKIITEIEENAFNPNTTSLVSILGMMSLSEDQYKNTLTVAEIYKGMTGEEYSGENGESTEISEKNKLVLEYVETTYGVGEEYVEFSDGIPYAYFDSETYQIVPRAKVKIKEVILASAIEKVKNQAFANQDFMTKFVYMSSKFAIKNAMSAFASDALTGCGSLTEVRFPNMSQTELEKSYGLDLVWRGWFVRGYKRLFV